LNDTATPTPPRARRQTITLDAGEAEGFAPGDFHMITAGTRRIGVIRLQNGEFRALRDWCPHKGAAICKGIVSGTWPPSSPGELRYERENEIVACPWHGFEYDLVSGAELCQPDAPKLRFYPTAIVDGRVVVTVPATRTEQGT